MEYQVMPDIREKEKIVGGLFTITQTIFLGLSVITGGLFGLGVFTLTSDPFLSVICIVIGAVPFLPFAFVTIESMGKMELFFYLMIKLKYKNGQKIFINLNENKRNRLMEEAS